VLASHTLYHYMYSARAGEAAATAGLRRKDYLSDSHGDHVQRDCHVEGSTAKVGFSWARKIPLLSIQLAKHHMQRKDFGELVRAWLLVGL